MGSKQDYTVVKENRFFVSQPLEAFYIGISKNIKWKKYYVFIKHIYIYSDFVLNDFKPRGENWKKIENKVYLTLAAAAELVNYLEPVYLEALSFMESEKGFIKCY